MGVAGGTPGSGPITRCRVLSTKDTMERTCDTCQGDSHTCKCCLRQRISLQVAAYASDTYRQDTSNACSKCCSLTVTQCMLCVSQQDRRIQQAARELWLRSRSYLHPHNSKRSAETGGTRSCRKREDLLGHLSIDGRHLGQRHQREGWHAICLVAQKGVAPLVPERGSHAAPPALACPVTV